MFCIRFPLDLGSPAASEGGLFPSLKSQAKKSEYENATDDERKREEVTAEEEEEADVRREQEQVRQILASAAALQAETSQSEWSEDDDDLSDESNEEEEQDQDCQGPLLGPHHSNGRKLCHNRRRKFHFGVTSDVESTGYTTDDAGLENLSVFNDAGLTDAEGIIIYSLVF